MLFTTRRGGVSAGPFASLNLGRLTDDDAATSTRTARGSPPRSVSRGALLLRPAGARRDGAARDRAARAGAAGRRRTARRPRSTTRRRSSSPPTACRSRSSADGAVAMLHGGWRGLAAGIVDGGRRRAARARRGGRVEAALGPGARGCCYEVGEEVHAAFAASDARRGERNLALDGVAREQLAAPASTTVHDTGLCTMCSDPALFFSHRRDGGVTGRQAGVAWRADRSTPRACATTLERIREEIARRRAPAATRGRRAARRRQVRRRSRSSARSPRPGSRSWARTAPRSSRRRPRPSGRRSAGTSSATSRAARSSRSSRTCELIHSVASDSVLRELERHGTPETRGPVEVNVAGEEGKAGIDPAELARLHRPLPGPRRRADDDAAGRRRPRGEPPALRRACASSPPRTGSPALDGDLAGLRGGGRGGGHDRAPRVVLCTAKLHAGQGIALLAPNRTAHGILATPGTARSSTSAWPRTATRTTTTTSSPLRSAQPEAELEDRYRERPNVRRLSTRRRRDEIDDIFADDVAVRRRTTVLRPVGGAPGQRPQRRPRAPRDPEVVQRRAGRRGQVQGLDPGDHQPPGRPRPTSPSA